jgi:hypothetical protein
LHGYQEVLRANAEDATEGEEKGKRELKKIVVPVVHVGKVDILPK